MDWQNLPSGSRIDDRRGSGGMPSGGIAVGGVGGLVIALVAMFFGIDPNVILGGGGRVAQAQHSQVQNQARQAQASDEMYTFIDKVMASNDKVWGDIFQRSGRELPQPVLVLYSKGTRSGCGTADSAVGPFYCPLDSKIYLDTSFFEVMKSRLGGGGTFAYSYVISHEYGHHLQNVLGISDQVERSQRQARTEAESNSYSVRLELQADCFAGVWGSYIKDQVRLNNNDIQTAIDTAQAIGDDTLQSQGRGVVVPEKFTHGTSKQRIKWFMHGFENSSPNACDTFSANYNEL